MPTRSFISVARTTDTYAQQLPAATFYAPSSYIQPRLPWLTLLHAVASLFSRAAILPFRRLFPSARSRDLLLVKTVTSHSSRTLMLNIRHPWLRRYAGPVSTLSARLLHASGLQARARLTVLLRSLPSALAQLGNRSTTPALASFCPPRLFFCSLAAFSTPRPKNGRSWACVVAGKGERRSSIPGHLYFVCQSLSIRTPYSVLCSKL